MDSLTQITLGAAVAEVVAGKKLGNRALIWGAIAGTIPDLDVISKLFLPEIDSLAFHRGFSHSIVFALLGTFIFPTIVTRIYRSKYHKHIASGLWFLTGLIVMLSVFSISYMPLVLILAVAVLVFIGYRLYQRYYTRAINLPATDIGLWRKLFFLSIITHPILDCFTIYGTQLFQPFSNYRVSFANISVADIFYTVPFITCVIMISFLKKADHRRRILAIVGLVISSVYMCYTLYNKYQANNNFKASLAENAIVYDRHMTGPSIITNFLWYGAADAGDEIKYGFHSVFDEQARFLIESLPKNHHLIDAKPDDKVINTLDWFSDGFWAVIELESGLLQINDLRFGVLSEPPGADDYIFSFVVEKQADGYYKMLSNQAGPPPDKRKSLLPELFKRIKGI